MVKTASSPPTSSSSSPPPPQSNQPKYTGVRKRKWGKWVSEIRLPNSRERIWLGSYDTPEKAARAFDAALYCLRGRDARFNFPDNPPDIVGAQSLSPPEVQAVAARFANENPVPISTIDNCSNGQNGDVSGQVEQSRSDQTTIDWSFLNNISEVGEQDFGFYDYNGLEGMGNEYNYNYNYNYDENLETDTHNGNDECQSFLWDF